MSKHHIVYVTTNLINFKVYVGVHSTDNLDDGYLGSGKAFLAAVKKYGKDNFRRHILHTCKTRQEALALERYYVTEELVHSTDAYNLTLGGNDSVARLGQLNWGSKTNMSEDKRKAKGQKALKTRIANGTLRTGSACNFSKDFLGEEALRAKAQKALNTRRESGVQQKLVAIMQKAKEEKAQGYVLISPTGERYDVKFNLKGFCATHELSYACLADRIHTGKLGLIIESNYTTKKQFTYQYYNTVGWSIYKKEEYNATEDSERFSCLHVEFQQI